MILLSNNSHLNSSFCVWWNYNWFLVIQFTPIKAYWKIISLRKNGILYLWGERISLRLGVNLISQDIVRMRMAGLRSALLSQGHTEIPEDLGLLSSSRSGTGLCSSPTKPPAPSVGAARGRAQVQRRHSQSGQSAATSLLLPRAQKLPAQYSQGADFPPDLPVPC